MSLTCVLIPFVKQWCDKNCWSICTLSLRMCKGTSTHKSQGMMLGPEQLSENVVVELPTSGQKKTPELELVAGSRAKGPEHFAIGNELSLLNESLCKKNGKTPAYLPLRQFQEELRTMAALTQQRTRDRINQLLR